MKPFKFEVNRVRRLYSGGSGIDELRGCECPQDTRFPEDWIASCIEGNGRAYHSPGHGISKLTWEGKLRSFPEFLHEHALEILGTAHLEKFGENPAVLTKLLDSAERLPLQFHPTKEDAKKFFHVDYGKTEAWIVLATRHMEGESPYLLIGFDKRFDKDSFVRESIAGEYKTGLEMLHKFMVKPGDVFVIHGGLPHAIGPGVTMVEVMEPSDLVILPEIDCCGVRLDEAKRFAGLGIEDAMSLVDFRSFSERELLEWIRPVQSVAKKSGTGTLRTLIPQSACGCFEVQELSYQYQWTETFERKSLRLGIQIEGASRIGDLDIRQGDSFLIPYDSPSLDIRGKGKIIFVFPPVS